MCATRYLATVGGRFVFSVQPYLTQVHSSSTNAPIMLPEPVNASHLRYQLLDHAHLGLLPEDEKVKAS